jgi:hypothetical protein
MYDHVLAYANGKRLEIAGDAAFDSVVHCADKTAIATLSPERSVPLCLPATSQEILRHLSTQEKGSTGVVAGIPRRTIGHEC